MMTFRTAAFFLIFLIAGHAASPAAANCGRFTQTKLQDGSQACLLALTTTEFTQTHSIDGGGPATKRTNKHTGGAVVLRMLGEPTTKATTRNKIRRRAMSVCMTYRGKFDGKVNGSANPFMVVIIGWGPKPEQPIKKGRLSETHRELYLTRNCRVTFEQ